MSMKRIFIFACLLLSAVMTFAQTKKVAILEVVDREGKLSYGNKMMLRANMARAVANTTGYEAYDRTDIDAIMNEHDFQRTGLVSEDQIQQVGKMTGVSLILVTEGVLAGTNSMFVSAKILNVETAKVEIVDNMAMDLDATSMQQACAQLAKRLFGATNYSTAVEKYSIQRMGLNEYMYNGKYLDKKAYVQFLRDNCPQAYKQYRDGKKWAISGWALMGAGVALTGAGIGMLVVAGNEEGGRLSPLDEPGEALVITGPTLTCLAVLIPIAIGYDKINRSHKTYNKKCASSTAAPLALGITAGPNGLGLALHF